MDKKEFATVLKSVANFSKVRSLILWTDRGAARHAKMLETDAAWDVFEKMEDSYFEKSQTQYGLKELPEPKTKKALPGCLTLEQQDVIKALVNGRAEGLPKEKKAAAVIKGWSAIKNKFGCTYKEISPDNFVNVISLITRLPIEGELLEKEVVNGITLTFDGDEPQKILVSVGQLGTTITKLLPDEEVIKKGQYYIMARKDSVSIRKLVTDYIPNQLLPDVIEEAGRHLKRIGTCK